MADSGGGDSRANNGWSSSITLTHLVLLNAVVAGLELAASAGFTYIPPMLLKAGFEEQHMSWIIGTGPFVCLIVVPLLGRWSDFCRSAHGRRIPFIFGLSLTVIAGLLLIPYSDHVVSDASFSTNVTGLPRRLMATLLALGVILLDFGTQACLTPCETLLSDVTEGTNMRERAFTVYSFMCSIGSCLGYLITAVDWEKTPVGWVCGDQENSVFALLIGLFSLTMVASLKTATSVSKTRSSIPRGPVNVSASTALLNGDLTSTENLEKNAPSITSPVHKPNGDAMGSNSSLRSKSKNSCIAVINERYYELTTESRLFFQRILTRLGNFLPYPLNELMCVPLVLGRLMSACFFAWAGVMCFVIFYTEYVGEVVYKGTPSSIAGTPERAMYESGLRMGSLGLLLHSVVSSFSAYLIEKLGKQLGLRTVFTACMAVFAVTTFMLVFIEDTLLVTFLATFTGIAFAALTTIPFTLMGLYHEDKQTYFLDTSREQQESRGMGSDMGLLDTTYFSSQVLLLLFMGYIVQSIGSAKAYMLVASIASAISCYFSQHVIYDKKDMLKAANLTAPPVLNGGQV